MEVEHKIQNCLLSESEESAHRDQNYPKPFHIYWYGSLPWASPWAPEGFLGTTASAFGILCKELLPLSSSQFNCF